MPEEAQEPAGSVVAVQLNPFLPDQAVIGYSAGFLVVWDTAARAVLNIVKVSEPGARSQHNKDSYLTSSS